MLYVYAIIDTDMTGAQQGGIPACEGILPEAPIRFIGEEGIAGVASEVPGAVFAGGALTDRLEDAAWTRERVLAHQRVVNALLPRYTVLPLKFCTLFADPEHLVAALRCHRDTLSEAMGRLRGCREWGVKMVCNREALAAWLGKTSPRLLEEAGASPGAAFFQHKRRERQLQEEAALTVARCVEDSHRRLAVCARSAVSNPPQPTPRGQRTDMVLNGAYLVATEAEEEMRACLRELAETYRRQGFGYALTGPWAPYNFTRSGRGQREFERFSAP